MKLQANLPKVWYKYWKKPEPFPEDASGPFHLRITSYLYIPEDGNYRFYAKTDAPNRAIAVIGPLDGKTNQIISPQNEDNLQYVMQTGMATHRIDYSDHIPIKKGLIKLQINYSGDEAWKIHNENIVRISGVHRAGIQLFWSSDSRIMELIPSTNLFYPDTVMR